MKHLASEPFLSKKNQARIKLGLRVLVALYILYLTKGIIEAALKGTSTMPAWVIVLVSAVFILSSVSFCFYAWRQYRRSLVDIEKVDEKVDEQTSK